MLWRPGCARWLTGFSRDELGFGVLPNGQLAISLAHCQQPTVWGNAQGRHRAWVLRGMSHLEGVQVIHLHHMLL